MTNFDDWNRRKAEGERGRWDDPDTEMLGETTRGTLPGFPMEIFSPHWQAVVKRAAHGAGVTNDHVALPLLSIVSGLVGCNFRVRCVGAWYESCSLWAAVVGYSGTGKTPGMETITRPLDHVEREQKENINKLRRAHETKVKAAKVALKAWEKAVEEAGEAGKEPPIKPAAADDPGPFVRPRINVSDTTIEKLAVLLNARPGGVILTQDELAGWFSNMGRYNKGDDRTFWLKAWNGIGHSVERMTRDLYIERLLVTIFGGLQPDKLKRSLSGDQDGMHARFLFSWPVEAPYKKLSDEADELDTDIVRAITRLVNELPQADGQGNFVSSSVSLTSEARQEFESFRKFHKAKNEDLYGRDREWWAKGPSQVLRLAGTLTFLEWAKLGGVKPGHVSKGTMEAATRAWFQYFWPHAQASLRLIVLTDDQTQERRALAWIRDHADECDENGVPLRKRGVAIVDLRRRAFSHSINAKETESLILRLERAGWLRKQTTWTEGRPVHRWEINPRLFTHAEGGRPPKEKSQPHVQKVQEVQKAPPWAEGTPLSALSALPAYEDGNGEAFPMAPREAPLSALSALPACGGEDGEEQGCAWCKERFGASDIPVTALNHKGEEVKTHGGDCAEKLEAARVAQAARAIKPTYAAERTERPQR